MSSAQNVILATQPLEKISYTTECRTIDVKTIDANKYKSFCENFDCYELLPNDRKIKPYFDIEIKPTHCEDGYEYNDCWLDIANVAMTQIGKYFPNPKVELLNASSKSYICCAQGIKKWIISLHIIVYNLVIYKVDL